MDDWMKLSVVTVPFGALWSADWAAESRGRRDGRGGHLNARTRRTALLIIGAEQVRMFARIALKAGRRDWAGGARF